MLRLWHSPQDKIKFPGKQHRMGNCLSVYSAWSCILSFKLSPSTYQLKWECYHWSWQLQQESYGKPLKTHCNFTLRQSTRAVSSKIGEMTKIYILLPLFTHLPWFWVLCNLAEKDFCHNWFVVWSTNVLLQQLYRSSTSHIHHLQRGTAAEYYLSACFSSFLEWLLLCFVFTWIHQVGAFSSFLTSAVPHRLKYLAIWCVWWSHQSPVEGNIVLSSPSVYSLSRWPPSATVMHAPTIPLDVPRHPPTTCFLFKLSSTMTYN